MSNNQNIEVLNKDIVAYFDFDGTITTRDTLVPYILHVTGYMKFIFKAPFILFITVTYLCGMITNEEAKEKFLTLMIKGISRNDLEKKAREFALLKLDKYINTNIYNKLEYHAEHKHSIVIVSANLAIYLRYWVKKHYLSGVIATEIDFNNNFATGKLKTKNCYGIEKVNRIKAYMQDHNKNYAYSYGYGNSKGDYELLEFVNEPYYIVGNFINDWSTYKNA
jgi:phosphatidylglycerophosphatase C